MADRINRAATRLGLAVALVVFLADFASKWLIINRLGLPDVGQIYVLPFFNLTWVQNYGVSGGFLLAQSDTQRWMLVALTGAIATGVGVWLWRERSRAEAAALGLVLGGAIGNILDRVRFGYVADFLDLHIGGWQPFLVFNIADAAISVGVVLLILRSVFGRKEGAPAEKSNA